MFRGDLFTLQKFKSIIRSNEDLNRFKDIFKVQRARILREHAREAATVNGVFDGSMSQRKKSTGPFNGRPVVLGCGEKADEARATTPSGRSTA